MKGCEKRGRERKGVSRALPGKDYQREVGVDLLKEKSGGRWLRIGGKTGRLRRAGYERQNVVPDAGA